MRVGTEYEVRVCMPEMRVIRGDTIVSYQPRHSMVPIGTPSEKSGHVLHEPPLPWLVLHNWYRIEIMI